MSQVRSVLKLDNLKVKMEKSQNPAGIRMHDLQTTIAFPPIPWEVIMLLMDVFNYYNCH